MPFTVHFRTTAFSLFALLAACGLQPRPETEISVSEALAFAPLGRGAQSRTGTTELAILDADTWRAYADSLHPIFPFDSVRFDQEMVLLAALEVPRGGYDLRFELVERVGDALLARYRVYVPGDDCRVTVGGGTVFQAVRLARTEGRIEFKLETELLDCSPPG